MNNFSIGNGDSTHSKNAQTDTFEQARSHLEFFIKQQFNLMSETSEKKLSSIELFDLLRFNKIPNFLTDGFIQSNRELFVIENQLRSYQLRTKFLNAKGLWQIEKVVKTLTENEIDFVIFKGVLAQGIRYQNYFLRPAGDIDILVQRSSFTKAKHALKSLDYFVQPAHETRWWTEYMGEQHLVSKTPDNPKIDLHYRIQKPGLPQPRFIEDFIKRKQFYKLGDLDVPVLAEIDAFLVSAASIVKAIFNREACLDHVTDAFVFLQNLRLEDLNSLERHAEKHDYKQVVQFTIRIVDIIFDDLRISNMAQKITILNSIDDETLKCIIFRPQREASYWPRRRSLLWELSGRSLTKFSYESCRALLAEIARRIHQTNDK